MQIKDLLHSDILKYFSIFFAFASGFNLGFNDIPKFIIATIVFCVTLIFQIEGIQAIIQNMMTH